MGGLLQIMLILVRLDKRINLCYYTNEIIVDCKKIVKMPKKQRVVPMGIKFCSI